ncbi:MAG: pentapeptide repeat-containing protein [Bacteroidetes bacterium]|nr:pentapeptide repeat-containing protein [Bacteroidota bacterium]
MKAHIDEELFERKDFTAEPLPKGEYTQCTFRQCTFVKADLIGVAFVECTFEGCDLSLARIRGTAFRQVAFTDCKLLGLSFDQANPFLFAIMPERCILDSCSFQGLDLKGARFRNCRLHGTDLSQADLSGATFDDCDLLDAVFGGTDLTRADLRSAHGYLIDPERNRLKGARFSTSGVGGLLARYGIELTHG